MSDTENLELKKRARRRLVGAAALALLAAIVLPMIMDDEPVVEVSDILVTIPDRTVDARPIASREPIDVLVPPVEREPDADAPVDVLPIETLPEAPSAPAPATPPPVAPAETKPPVSTTPPSAATKPPATPPAAAKPPADEAAEAARARAILEGRGAAAEAPPARGFVVQIGAFGDLAKANARQGELAARGFKAFIETADGVSRVRLGPFSTRSDAEAAVRRLEAASIDGMILAR